MVVLSLRPVALYCLSAWRGRPLKNCSALYVLSVEFETNYLPPKERNSLAKPDLLLRRYTKGDVPDEHLGQLLSTIGPKSMRVEQLNKTVHAHSGPVDECAKYAGGARS